MNYIRQANVNDLERIAEIEVFNYRLNFYPIFKNDEYYFKDLKVSSLINKYQDVINDILVYDDGVVKGFIYIDNLEVKKLFVEPILQGSGIGANLIDTAINKYHVNNLWALEKNTKAINFYLRHGFKLTGERILEEDTDEYLVRLRY